VRQYANNIYIELDVAEFCLFSGLCGVFLSYVYMSPSIQEYYWKREVCVLL